MGFTSSFLSGLTLTTCAFYLTLLAHQRHRQTQSTMLHQQTLLLNSIFDHSIIPLEDAPRFVVRQASWTEMWRDRWNSEVENTARWIQEVKWKELREGVEARLNLWRDDSG